MGATSCSWCSLCECAHVHFYTNSQRFGPFLINTQMHFHKRDSFDMPKNAPNSSEKQHRKKHFVVRNDEKSGPTYQRDPRRNNATSQYFNSRLQHLCLAHSSSGLCFCANATQTLLALCDWYSSYRLACGDGSTRKGRSLCVHTALVLCARHSLRGFVVTEEVHFLQVISPSTCQWLAEIY